MNTQTPLHHTVKFEMIKKGITQRDVTRHFKCSESYVSKALHGVRDSFLQKIAKYIAKSPSKRQRLAA